MCQGLANAAHLTIYSTPHSPHTVFSDRVTRFYKSLGLKVAALAMKAKENHEDKRVNYYSENRHITASKAVIDRCHSPSITPTSTNHSAMYMYFQWLKHHRRSCWYRRNRYYMYYSRPRTEFFHSEWNKRSEDTCHDGWKKSKIAAKLIHWFPFEVQQ